VTLHPFLVTLHPFLVILPSFMVSLPLLMVTLPLLWPCHFHLWCCVLLCCLHKRSQRVDVISVYGVSVAVSVCVLMLAGAAWIGNPLAVPGPIPLTFFAYPAGIFRMQPRRLCCYGILLGCASTRRFCSYGILLGCAGTDRVRMVLPGLVDNAVCGGLFAAGHMVMGGGSEERVEPEGEDRRGKLLGIDTHAKVRTWWDKVGDKFRR